MIRLFWVAIIFLLISQVSADEFIPIRVESELICEAPLRFVISIENISVEPFNIKNVHVEPTGKWLSGSLFLGGEGYRNFSHLHGGRLLDNAEEQDANRLIEMQPGEIKRIQVELEKMYQVDINALIYIVFSRTIYIGNDNYYVSHSFNFMDYCSDGEKKHIYRIIKNDNWDKVKEEFEKQKRDAEKVPKYLRKF